jgi:hypothetical protein
VFHSMAIEIAGHMVNRRGQRVALQRKWHEAAAAHGLPNPARCYLDAGTQEAVDQFGGLMRCADGIPASSSHGDVGHACTTGKVWRGESPIQDPHPPHGPQTWVCPCCAM